MTRQALSSAQHWTTSDGNFDYVEFYNFLLDILDGSEDDPWYDALMQTWNM